MMSALPTDDPVVYPAPMIHTEDSIRYETRACLCVSFIKYLHPALHGRPVVY